MGAGPGQAHLLEDHPPVYQTLQLASRHAGTIQVELFQKCGFLDDFARCGQLLPGEAGGRTHRLQISGVGGAGNGGEPGELVSVETGRQERLQCLKWGAAIGVPDPFGQLQPQGADEGRGFDGMQDVSRGFFGHRRPIGKAGHDALDVFSAELHPHELTGFHGQMARDAV